MSDHFNWTESRPHRAAFTRLPRRVDGPIGALSLDDYWSEKLGEPQDQAIRRWVSEGHYHRCDFLETLSLCLTVEALKSMLRERNQKVSGKKSELIDRVMSTDRSALEALAERNEIWLLTIESIALLNEIRSEFAHEEGLARIAIAQRLAAGDAHGAYSEWEAYDKSQVFSLLERMTPGLTYDAWRTRSVDELERILRLGKGEIGVRLGVGALFGETPTDNDSRAALVQSAWEHDIKAWKGDGFVVGVRIRPPQDSLCRAAARAAGCWRLNDAPSMPPTDCEDEFGCRCFWESIFDDEADKIILWQK